MNYQKLQTFAEKTAIKAGNLLLKEQSNVQIVEYKDSVDFATNADLKSEKLIISEIELKYPKHNILSEELGFINNNSQYTWVVDPLDGTKEYARDMHRFSVLISCQNQSKLIAGCAHFPKLQKTYSAGLKQSATRDGKKIKVSRISKLSRSRVWCRFPSNKLTEPKYSQMWDISKLVSQNVYKALALSYSDVLPICRLARGVYDGYFVLHDKGPKWHDIAAGLIVAQQAGAKITDRFGKPIKLDNLKDGLVITNGKIHDQLLKLINQ